MADGKPTEFTSRAEKANCQIFVAGQVVRAVVDAVGCCEDMPFRYQSASTASGYLDNSRERKFLRLTSAADAHAIVWREDVPFYTSAFV